MKSKLVSLLIAAIVSINPILAQDITTVDGTKKTTGRKVEKDWKPASEKNKTKTGVNKDAKKDTKKSNNPKSNSERKSTEKINKPSKQQIPADKPVKQTAPNTTKRRK